MSTTADELPDLPASARRQWVRLASPTDRGSCFDAAMVEHLPAPARRWLGRAITPGAPLLRSVELAMHGTIRLGSWRRFEARQVLAPPAGFIWAATAHLAGLPIRGYDRYTDTTGEMRWRALGVIPVMGATGDDVTRSAEGRLASEIIFAPAAALASGANWQQVGDRQVTTQVRIGPATFPVTLTVRSDGSLEAVTLLRWGRPDKRPYGLHVFGAQIEEEGTFEGFTIPTRVSAGWWLGTDRWPDGEFIRFRVDRATYR